MTLRRKIFYFLLLALAFVIPVYGRVVPPVIVFLFFAWLAEGRFIRNIPRIFKEKRRFAVFSLSLIYFVYLAGMTYTSNSSYGWFDLEVKLSLFIFPLIFSTLDDDFLNPPFLSRLMVSFTSGALVSTVFLLVLALVRTIVYGMKDVFFYSGLSFSHHPSYLSMFLCFSAGYLLLCFFCDEWNVLGISRYQLFTLVVYFFLFIFLLSSKAGILSLGLVFVLVSAFLIFAWKRSLAGFVLLVIAAAGFYAGMRLLPFTAGRFSKMEKTISGEQKADSISQESNAERILIWRSALRLIGKHPMTGVGTGDVKDELLKGYETDHNLPAQRSKLNAHNQYLQTTLALGIPGLLSLLYFLLLPLVLATRSRNFLFLAFLLLTAFNLSVESMLEVQAGVVFFGLFNSVMLAVLLGRAQKENVC